MPFTCGTESAVSIIASPSMHGIATTNNIVVASATKGRAGYALITSTIRNALKLEIAAEAGVLLRIPMADVFEMLRVRVIHTKGVIDTRFSALPTRTVEAYKSRFQVARMSLETEITARDISQTGANIGLDLQRVMVYLDSSFALPSLIEQINPTVFLGAIVITDASGQRIKPGQLATTPFICTEHPGD